MAGAKWLSFESMDSDEGNGDTDDDGEKGRLVVDDKGRMKIKCLHCGVNYSSVGNKYHAPRPLALSNLTCSLCLIKSLVNLFTRQNLKEN
jgi:hypothetical protein